MLVQAMGGKERETNDMMVEVVDGGQRIITNLPFDPSE